MNICGIITEYNPFHYGHKLHLESAKKLTKADAIVCVMSGNFMQRGLPALMDKWTRSKIAVNSGVDLVIELPTLFAVSSAEFFAKGAIDILNKVPDLNSLFFGSEDGSTTLLEECASLLATESFELQSLIKENMVLGTPYTIARGEALYSLLSKNYDISKEDFLSFLNSSNNILGLEYIKALKRSNSAIKAHTFKRTSNDYNSINLTGKISSATAIRNAIKNSSIESIKDVLPLQTYTIMKELEDNNYTFMDEEKAFPYIKYKILTNPDCLNKIPECNEGLNNKIFKEIINSISYKDLIMKVKSKRYTYTRISRILMQVFIGFDKYDIKNLRNSSIDYIRVLAFNDKGRQILKNIKSNNNVKIITKFPKKIDNPLIDLDLLSTHSYHILNPQIDFASDYLNSPYVKL